MNLPPTQKQISAYQSKHPVLSYSEARKRLLKDFFFEELREIDFKSDILATEDLRFKRLLKVVEWILTQI
jgi:hypothetical protein